MELVFVGQEYQLVLQLMVSLLGMCCTRDSQYVSYLELIRKDMECMLVLEFVEQVAP
jgi:hypothetical protein